MSAVSRIPLGTSSRADRPDRSSDPAILRSSGTPILLFALAAFLGAFQLGGKSLWHDEAFTVAVAHSDGDTFRRNVLGPESFAGLYYAIVRTLPGMWANEASLRAPSVAFAALATLASYAVARRLFGFRVAAIAALLLTVNLVFVEYAQEARAYALALWLTTVATWLLVRAVQEPTWRRWLAFGVVAAAAVYAHFFAAFVVAGQLLSLLPYRSMVPWRKVAGAAGLAGVLVLPLAVVLLLTNKGGRPLLAQTSIAALPSDIAGIPSSSLGVVQGVVYLLCGAGTLVVFLRRRRHQDADPFDRWRYALLACWLAVPLALAGLVSLFWPIFVTRYFVVCLPAVVLLVAVGLAVARPAVQAAVLVLVLLASAQWLHGYYPQTYKDGENWRGLVQHVAEEAHPGDSVIFLSHFGRRPFEYYLSRHAGLAAALTPAHPSMRWDDYPPTEGEKRVAAAAVDATKLEAANPDRVWVVLLWGGFRTGDDDGALFYRTLTRAYEQTDNRFFGRYLKLALFERRTVVSFQGSLPRNE